MASEALEWTRGTWTLDQIRAALEKDFGLVRERNSLRNLLVELGIEPAIKQGSRDSGRGRVSYYDRLVTLVAYVAYMSDTDRSELRRRLDEHREVAAKAVWGRLADAPKKRDPYLHFAWDWRVDSTAFHLFISDTRHGLEPRRLHQALESCPRILYLTLDGSQYLESVLRGYVARYVREFSGVNADPNDVNLFAGTRRPVFGGRIESTETLEILEQFSLIKPDGRRLSAPNHVFFDEPDIYSEGEYAPQ